METAIGTFQADKEAAFTPKRGKIKPIDIISLERPEIDEKIVIDLVQVLARDGGFLQDIGVRDEGANRYRLIFGANRLEASKRHFGEEAPISAIIYPPHTPDALIAIFEYEENLLRRHLTAAERERQTILLAAALKKLDDERSLTPVSDSGEAETGNPVPRLASAAGGRGNKGVAQRVAEKAGITKRAVRKRLKAASAAIGEKIDLDRDTPEELERKAAELERMPDKRQRAEPKVVRLKRRKPEPPVEDATPPAEPHAGEIDSQIEAWLKAFDTFGETYRFRLAYLVCIRLGLDPLKMAPAAVFGLAEEEHELAVDQAAQATLVTDDALVAAQDKQRDDDAAAEAEQGDDAAGAQADEQDAKHLGAEGQQDGDNAAEEADDDVAEDPKAVDQEDFGAEDLQDSGDNTHHAADQEPGGATKCAYCTMEFYSSDERVMIHGRLYHADLCAKFAKPIAIAA